MGEDRPAEVLARVGVAKSRGQVSLKGVNGTSKAHQKGLNLGGKRVANNWGLPLGKSTGIPMAPCNKRSIWPEIRDASEKSQARDAESEPILEQIVIGLYGRSVRRDGGLGAHLRNPTACGDGLGVHVAVEVRQGEASGVGDDRASEAAPAAHSPQDVRYLVAQ